MTDTLKIWPYDENESFEDPVYFNDEEYYDTLMFPTNNCVAQKSAAHKPFLRDLTKIFGTSADKKRFIIMIYHKYSTTKARLDTLFSYNLRAFRVYWKYNIDNTEYISSLLDPNYTESYSYGHRLVVYTPMIFYESY